MLEPIVEANTWGPIIQAVPNIVFVIAVVLVYLLAMLKGYSHTKFEDVAISILQVLSCRSVFQYLSGFAICLLTSSSAFTLFLCSYLRSWNGQRRSARRNGIRQNKDEPEHQPKKTVEGAACGLVFSLILNAIAFVIYNKVADASLDAVGATILLACCIPVSFMGMMGDLSASVLKRNFGVKDFGKIFPGHGGVMDRFDSVLFTMPVTYAIALIAFC